MYISKRNIVRIISFAIAGVGALSVRNIQLMTENKINNRALEYTYMRAVEELSTAADNINNTLEKQIYAGTPELQQQLSSKLWRESSTAKAALAQLPIQELQLENTYKFLSQVGNYALSLAEKSSHDKQISDEEYKKLKSLHDFADRLCDDMWELESSINSGEISLMTVASSMKAPDEDAPNVTEGFTDFEEGFDAYPTLIYDGPFSDHILEKNPKMTANSKEITEQKALERATMATGINSTDFTQVSEEAGKMPSWVFSDNKGTISCAVTKNGGYLSYFIKNRLVNNESISMDQGLSAAKKFLADLGINSMKTTYYEDYNGILTVNFAYNDNDICVYPDLIKVSVALDNGEILGYDARGFIVNHEDRTYSNDRISPLDAEKKVSPMLTIESRQLALIPSEGTEERFCYEFKCRNQEGGHVLVYVNAVTGEEEQILILFESENGTLTM